MYIIHYITAMIDLFLALICLNQELMSSGICQS